ncbi:MAG: hypothetical protein QME14_00895 [Methanobacteriaceae archaeon]|nr:hypothetical protein [Methanobacteriaceae archaeon]
MNPLEDTMADLFTDLMGGIAGAIIGIFLIKRAEKKGKCVEWVDGIAKLGMKDDESNETESSPPTCNLGEDEE